MPREFRFGSDPEFIVVGINRAGQDRHVTNVGSIFNASVSQLGRIGRNGRSDTAEMRTRVVDSIEALWAEIARVLEQDGRRRLSQANPAQYGQNFERLALKMGPLPHSVPCGAHIHITSNDPDWFYTKQAVQVLPFFVSLPCWLYDKGHARRARSSGYGKHGDVHASPDYHSHMGTIEVAGESLSAWPGGWKGWEYRTPSCFVAPQNQAFRDKLGICINGVLQASDHEAEKQYKFLKKVCREVGTNIRRELDNSGTTEEQYQERYRRIKRGRGSRGTGSLASRFNDQTEDIYRACLSAKADVDIQGFDEIFDDINRYIDTNGQRWPDLNPSVIWPPARATLPMPVPQFDSITDAVSALSQAYEAYVESLEKGSWIARGKYYLEKYPFSIVMEDGVARDRGIPDITWLSLALAQYAVQRVLKAKFLPRNDNRAYIYGGAETRYSERGNLVALFPSPVHSMRAMRDLFEAGGYSIDHSGDENVYLRRSFRDEDTPLRFISVATFMLWKQGYINES